MAKKKTIAVRKWLQHPESDQVFEAEGIEVYHAERRGCFEVPAPKPIKENPGKGGAPKKDGAPAPNESGTE